MLEKMKNSYKEQQKKLEEKVWGPVNVCHLLVHKTECHYLSISNHWTYSFQDVCPAVHHICSVAPSLILVLSCSFICCVCDVVSLPPPVMWLSLWISVTSLLWLSLCLVNREAMGKEHQENKRAIHDGQQKLSEQSAVSMKHPSHWYFM